MHVNNVIFCDIVVIKCLSYWYDDTNKIKQKTANHNGQVRLNLRTAK